MLWVLAEEVDFPDPHKACDLVNFPQFHLILGLDTADLGLQKAFHKISKSFLSSTIKAQSLFWRSSLNQSLQASMDSREIWKENYDFKETEFASHLADNHVLFVKMSTKHFGSVASRTFNFYAHLKAILMLVPILSEKISTSSPFLAEGTSCSFFCNKAH